MSVAPRAERRGRRLVLALPLLIAIALAARLPSLAWGFLGDDLGLMLVLERGFDHPTMRWWSLFDFGHAPPPGEEDVAWNHLPWWTSPDWKGRFFRPVASLMHAADFALHGRAAARHHATSLALFALLLALLHALYRAAGLSRALALGAVAVFAFDDGSVMPVSWLANRNSLVEAVFAVLAVLVLLRGGRAPGGARFGASLALALVAALCKESGVVTFAALAIALAILARRADETAVRARLARFAAVAAACGAAYVVFLLAAGYGTRSLFYVLPWTHPLQFAGRALTMAALGAQGAVGPFVIDLAMFEPRAFVPSLLVALAVGVPIAWRIAKAAREVPWAALFAAWGILALLPQCGTMPSDRLLFVPMIGFAPLIASFALRALDRGRPWRARWLPALVAVLAIPLSALALHARTLRFVGLAESLRAATLSAEVPRDGTPCDALVFQSGSILSMLSPDAAWAFLSREAIESEAVNFHPLQVGGLPVRIATVDGRAFDLEVLEGVFLDSPFEEVFLSRAETYAPGRTWRGRGFGVEALSVADGRLRAIRVTLDEPIASPRWRFLAWRDGAFRRFELPPPGGSLILKRAVPLDPDLP